jgi:site-specific recombinase XerD
MNDAERSADSVEAQLTLCKDWLTGESNSVSAARARLKDLRSSPQAPATVKAYASDWKLFSNWCTENHLSALPADPETIALYLSHSLPTRSVSTLIRRTASIASKHLMAAHLSPINHGIRTLLETMAKKSKRKPNRKAAISISELLQISQQLTGEDTVRSIRDRSLILLGFAGAFRRSELAGLDLSDIDLRPERVTIKLGRTKTDQLARGRELVIPQAKNSSLCPIVALHAWLDKRGRWPGPLYTDIRGKVVLEMAQNRIDPEVVWYALRSAATRAGMDDPKKFGAHSLRAGFVTTAAEAGADLFDIMATTGHKSLETLNTYVRSRSVPRYALRAVL